MTGPAYTGKIDLTNLETAELIKWVKDIYGLLRICQINTRQRDLPPSYFIHSAAPSLME